MQVLNGRQRVAAASLLKRRPALPGARLIPDELEYKLWYELVCSEMGRLGVVDPSQVREFCDRAGVQANGAVQLSAAPPTAA